MTQLTIFDPSIPVSVRAPVQVRHQVLCRVCDWKGLYSDCEKDDLQRLHCPVCHLRHLRDRDETEDFEGDSSKVIAGLRKRYFSQEQEYREGKITMAKALVEMGVRR
jgi:hypothetical protein